jgi:hypothetical protein
MAFDETIRLAFELYKADFPVVLKDKSGCVIHGEEELRSLDPRSVESFPTLTSPNGRRLINTDRRFLKVRGKGGWKNKCK